MWNSLSTLSTISSISTFVYFVLLIACLLGFMLTPAVVYARLNLKKRKTRTCILTDWYLRLFPWYLRSFPGKYAQNCGFKSCKNARSGAITLIWKKPLKGINLSNEHSFVLFRGCRYIYIYIYNIYICIRIWYLMIYIYTYVYDTREFIYTYLYCMTEPTRRKKCKTSPLHIPESQLLFFVL
jgi:hypothetical protein